MAIQATAIQGALLGVALTSGLVHADRASAAQSNGFERGGGNAVVCFNTPAIPREIRALDPQGRPIDPSIQDDHIPHITSIELLDLYEARFSRGIQNPSKFELLSPNRGETALEFSTRLFRRIENLMPGLHGALIEAMSELPSDEVVRVPSGLMPVNDHAMVGRINSRLCVVSTIAMQQDVGGGNTKIYVDGRIFDHPKFDDSDRALTYVHEVVYHAARRSYRHDDSQGTRLLVGTLLRKNLSAARLYQEVTSAELLSESDRAFDGSNPAPARLITSLYNILNGRLQEGEINACALMEKLHPELKLCSTRWGGSWTPREWVNQAIAGEEARLLELMKKQFPGQDGCSKATGHRSAGYDQCLEDIEYLAKQKPSLFGYSQEEIDRAKKAVEAYGDAYMERFKDELNKKWEELFAAAWKDVKAETAKQVLLIYQEKFASEVAKLVESNEYSQDEVRKLDEWLVATLSSPENYVFWQQGVDYRKGFSLSLVDIAEKAQARGDILSPRSVPVH